MASGACYSSDYDMEYRRDADDAWYTVNVVVGDGGETLKVKYEGFLESSDVTFRADAFAQVEEIDKLVKRLRPLSRQVQDKECHTIIEGMTLCASYSFGQDELHFYDAVVEADLCKKDVDKELKVVRLGTEAFRKAKQLKSLFLEFGQHGQRLSRKFAAEVTRILELST